MSKPQIWILLLCGWSLLPAMGAWAQSQNLDDCGNGSEIMTLPNKAIGICNLDGATYHFDDEANKVIPFSIRSCWASWEGNEHSTAYCNQSRDYTVEVSGPVEDEQFILMGSGGELPISLALRQSSTPAEIPVDGESSRFQGSVNGGQIPVEFEVDILTPLATLTPGSYSGTFYFYLYQCNPWGDPDNPHNPILCKDSSNTGNRSWLSPPIPFTVEVTVLPKIRISNLQDLHLVSGTGEAVEGGYSFCVHSATGSRFSLQAESQNGSGEFTLLGNTGVDSALYELSVGTNKQAQGQLRSLQEGQAEQRPQWRGHPQDGCNNGTDNNMRLQVQIPESELSDLADSIYTDTVTLTVQPE